MFFVQKKLWFQSYLHELKFLFKNKCPVSIVKNELKPTEPKRSLFTIHSKTYAVRLNILDWKDTLAVDVTGVAFRAHYCPRRLHPTQKRIEAPRHRPLPCHSRCNQPRVAPLILRRGLDAAGDAGVCDSP